MSPHLCAVGKEAPLGDEYTFLMWSADITHRQVTGQSGTHTNGGLWLLGQTSPSTVLDSHSRPIHVHVRGGRSHLGQWARSPHWAEVTTSQEPTHTHMGLNWKPLSAVHITSHTVSAVHITIAGSTVHDQVEEDSLTVTRYEPPSPSASL